MLFGTLLHCVNIFSLSFRTHKRSSSVRLIITAYTRRVCRLWRYSTEQQHSCHTSVRTTTSSCGSCWVVCEVWSAAHQRCRVWEWRSVCCCDSFKWHQHWAYIPLFLWRSLSPCLCMYLSSAWQLKRQHALTVLQCYRQRVLAFASVIVVKFFLFLLFV